MTIRNLFRHTPASPNPVTDFCWMGENDYADCEDLTKFMAYATEQGAYTQDLPDLMKQERQLIFAYGTLREGFLRHQTLKHQKFIGYGSTDNRYNMFITKNHKAPYPVVMLEGRADKVGSIFGEVYSVVPSCLQALDYLESNGSIYKRHLTAIHIGNKDGSIKTLYAWMYKGMRSFWGSRQSMLAQVEPCTTKNSEKGRRYYMFRHSDIAKITA